MSQISELARSRAKAKVSRLVAPNKGSVDASGWQEPGGENGDAQTGPKPVSRRQFRRGGKVEGMPSTKHAGRKPRASGGTTKVDGALVDRDVKDARGGNNHVGGMKHGGSCGCAKCGGGRVGRKAGGTVNDGTRPAGDRIARKGGGRAKKGMNVNIIIAPGGGGPKPMGPPPGLADPPGGPIGMHQGAPPPPMPPPGAAPPMGPPMMRKAGGRVADGQFAKPGKYPLKDGSGGGKGRLEKARAYG